MKNIVYAIKLKKVFNQITVVGLIVKNG